MLENTGNSTQNLFLLPGIAVFWKVYHQPLIEKRKLGKFLKKWSYNLLNISHNNLWPFLTSHLRSVKFVETRREVQKNSRESCSIWKNCVLYDFTGNTRKSRPKSFFPPGRWLFFSKKNTSTSYDFKKSSYKLHNNFRKTLWPLFNCNLMSVILHKTRKIWLKIFFHRKSSFFLKPFFDNESGVKKLSLDLNCFCLKTFWSLKNVSGCS